MPATYEPIATYTLTSSSAPISFTSIPNTYTDLRLVFSGLSGTTNSAQFGLRFNSDSGSNYSAGFFYGNAAFYYTQINRDTLNLVDTASVAGIDNARISPWTIDILSYNSAIWKTVLFKSGQTYWGVLCAGAGTWRSTSAITQIDLITSAAFAATTTATLFGILKA